mmetsp:Transcript_115104/g.245954  ORF Transcript_115104/g.245954 Transcript_115104/m.245954 type:complete len:225 (+) Transcript_115104:1134-1808(+)
MLLKSPQGAFEVGVHRQRKPLPSSPSGTHHTANLLEAIPAATLPKKVRLAVQRQGCPDTVEERHSLGSIRNESHLGRSLLVAAVALGNVAEAQREEASQCSQRGLEPGLGGMHLKGRKGAPQADGLVHQALHPTGGFGLGSLEGNLSVQGARGLGGLRPLDCRRRPGELLHQTRHHVGDVAAAPAPELLKGQGLHGSRFGEVSHLREHLPQLPLPAYDEVSGLP